MTDKETTDELSASSSEPDEGAAPDPAPPAELSPKVERALAAARAAAKADHQQRSGRWLAAIPLSVAVLLLLLMLPRSTPPDGVPLPRIDHRVTKAVAAAEEALAQETDEHRLPGDILAVGTMIRDLNVAESSGSESDRLIVRGQLDTMLATVVKRPGFDQDLVRLRAAQTRTFLQALREWESGQEPKDFVAAGGSFVQRATEAGWVDGRHILFDDIQRRVAFKTVWNAITHLSTGTFALTLDEERALYAFYIEHPRVPEGHRLALEAKRHDAKTPEACAHARADWRRELELWRADKIKRLAVLDPSYPTYYALGVTYFHAGRVDLAVDAFNAYLEGHPEGPYALRARNHLKATLVGASP